MTAPIAAIESEHALIGAALFDPPGCAEVFERVRPDHMFDPVHAALWEHLRTGELVDPVLLAQRMGDHAGLDELGGVGFLVELADRAFMPTIGKHADAVLDAAIRRSIVKVAQYAVADAAIAGRGEDLIGDVERQFGEIAKESFSGDLWRPAWEVTENAVRAARARNGRVDFPCGLESLDRLTGGFRRGEMAIVAGRPAMGKSTAALALAKGLAAGGKGVAFFSMEMPAVSLGLRMACDLNFDPYAPRQYRVSYFDADQGRLNGDQWRDLEGASARITRWPLLFDTRPGLTTGQIEACARRAFRRWEADGIERGAIVVDHLTIAKPDIARSGNKVAEVGDISRGLAEMAKRLDVPVIALCQLSRDVEKRDTKDKRPGLADLRWSGEIEQDARLVMFLYRPEYYLKRPQDENDDEAMIEWKAKLDKVRHKLWFLVEKNNNGPTGEVETYCDIGCSAIRDKLGDA